MERIMYRKTLDVHKNGIQFMLQGFETADNMSRVIEISLMASGDAVDFPLERMVAMMYVTTPGATGPSINECTIKDNKVVYNVLPIVEEGITTMQLKLVETSPEGATSVLCSPKFAVEVTKSGVDDGSAEQSTTFTALEDAVAKAKSTYDERLLRVEINEKCTFRAYYADGTVYETDALREYMLNGNALWSKSYAVGETGIRDNEDADNSKYYSNVSRSSAEEARIDGDHASRLLAETRKQGVYTSFAMDFETGELLYVSPTYNFDVSEENGELYVEGKTHSFEETIREIVEETANQNSGADYVVEEGTITTDASSKSTLKTVWRYKIWASGYAECWGESQYAFYTNDVSNAYNKDESMRDIGGPRKYPFKFISTPTEQVNIFSNMPTIHVMPICSSYTYVDEMYGSTTMSGINSNEHTGAYKALVYTESGTYTTIDLKIYFYVAGRYWKKWDEEV
jgi:hypothetical protein